MGSGVNDPVMVRSPQTLILRDPGGRRWRGLAAGGDGDAAGSLAPGAADLLDLLQCGGRGQSGASEWRQMGGAVMFSIGLFDQRVNPPPLP